MTARRAAVIAALVAALVYLPALGNRFALDDGPIVERNPAAHSLGAAAAAFAHPYWPPEHGAGLWRPVVILSFATDWTLSGGSPAWLHATNALLHAAVTALLVLVIAPYVTVAGALAGGLFFAVHPVHVEAVANLVGRAELLVALGLLAAMLLARRARQARAEGRQSLGWEAATLLAVLFGLLSKEHAVVAIALLWLDDRASPGPGRLPARTYGAVVVMTATWLLVRRSVEGGLSFEAVAPTFFHLGAVGRVSTMLPAFLVVMRLLAWPFDLSPDYHPMVIERLEHPTPAGAFALVVLVSVVTLAILLWRRHRPAALGLLVIGVAWAPTSNFLFPTGIVLAERTLYLASAGLALLAALGFDALARQAQDRRARFAAAIVLVAFAAKTVLRIPVWRSTRDLVIAAMIEHPESYKVHQSAARVLWRIGLHEQGLAEYRVAAEIYPLDPYLLTEMGSAGIEAGHDRQALAWLRRSESLDPRTALTHELMAQALLRADSVPAALAQARLAVTAGPTRPEAARMLAASFLALHQKDSALAVWPRFRSHGGTAFERWLLGAVTYATAGLPDSARLAIDSARTLLPADSVSRRRFSEAQIEIRRLSGRL